MAEYSYYNYEEFLEGIQLIEKSIRESGWFPDYIVGVVRGGAIPAVYLSHLLNVPVCMVAWSTRDRNILSNETNCIIPDDLYCGKNILLIDDIVDSGDTIRELLEDWQGTNSGDPRELTGKLPVDNLRIAAMYYNTSQSTNVDFYHHTIDRELDPRWIVFPWEC